MNPTSLSEGWGQFHCRLFADQCMCMLWFDIMQVCHCAPLHVRSIKQAAGGTTTFTSMAARIMSSFCCCCCPPARKPATLVRG